MDIHSLLVLLQASKTAASAVHQRLIDQYGTVGSNNNIPYGFEYFTYTSNNKIYKLDAIVIWRGQSSLFSLDTIVNEIDAGRLVMLGLAAGYEGSPYGNHMIVCVGYEREGNDLYVYVSDAHKREYVRRKLSIDTYNDCLITVRVIAYCF